MLTPRLSRVAFARVLGTADVIVSPTFTDGTPNFTYHNLQSEVGVITLFEHGSDENPDAAIPGAVGPRPAVVYLPEHYSIHAHHARVLEFYAKAVSQDGRNSGVDRTANQSRA